MEYQAVQSAEVRDRYRDLLAMARLRGEAVRFEEADLQTLDELGREGGLGELNYWLPTGRPVNVQYALYAAERVAWLFRLDPAPVKG